MGYISRPEPIIEGSQGRDVSKQTSRGRLLASSQAHARVKPALCTVQGMMLPQWAGPCCINSPSRLSSTDMPTDQPGGDIYSAETSGDSHYIKLTVDTVLG